MQTRIEKNHINAIHTNFTPFYVPRDGEAAQDNSQNSTDNCSPHSPAFTSTAEYVEFEVAREATFRQI